MRYVTLFLDVFLFISSYSLFLASVSTTSVYHLSCCEFFVTIFYSFLLLLCVISKLSFLYLLMFVNVDFFKISIPFREVDRSSILWIVYPEKDFPICSLITCYLNICFFCCCLLLISIILKRLFQF